MSDLVAGRYPLADETWMLDGQPVPPYRRTCSRQFGAGTFTLVTATMYIYPIVVQAGDIFNFLTVIVKTQMTSSGHNWAAIYNGTTSTATLVAKTADTTAGWGSGGNTAVKLSLTTAAANAGTVGTPQGPSTAAIVNSGPAVWAVVLYNSTAGTGTILDAATVAGDVAGNIGLTGQIPVTQTATLTATGTPPSALNAAGVGTLTAASANVPYCILSNQ